MAGRASKNKGGVYERELVGKLKDLEYHAERVHGSGAIGTRYSRTQTKVVEQTLEGDVLVVLEEDAALRLQLPPMRFSVEVKFRSDEFAAWLQNLTHPIRVGDLGFVPGYDVIRAVMTNFSEAPEWNKPTSKYSKLMGNCPVLTCRFPKPTRSSTGWVTVVKLSQQTALTSAPSLPTSSKTSPLS